MKILFFFLSSYVLFIFTGCSMAGVAQPKHVGLDYGKYIKIPILLATDRKINKNRMDDLAYFFENERGSGKLHYAEVNVSIPSKHKIGTLDERSIFRFEFLDTPENNMIVWKNPSLLERKDFYSIFQKRLIKYDDGDIIIFIHGYNNDINEAVLRTAQISYDLESVLNEAKFQKHFIPMTYSWSSKDDFEKYLTDYESAEWSVPHLKEFLLDVYNHANGKKINVIVHSMGNQVFTKAISELHQENKELKLNQVILAAPDVDAKIFMDNIVPAIGKTSIRTTIYMSDKDKALMASEAIRIQESRIGRGDSDLVKVIDTKKLQLNKIDLINASDVEFSLWGLNHSYFAEIEIVIRDISKALFGVPLEQRNIDTLQPWAHIREK